MLTNLQPQSVDKILALMQEFRNDPRADKIDLGVGVYKNARGITPVMHAVKMAEKQLWEAETTKTYTALAGDPAFGLAMADLVLAASVERARLAVAATPGGTGALHQGLELIRMAAPAATIWVSSPTWPNHISIIRYLGLPMRDYRYFDKASRGVDFAAMSADLEQVAPGDVVLLHGCCHNPTGANLTQAEWRALTDLLIRRGAVPFVDIAYQGFGDGLELDAFGVRHLAAQVPEMLVAASCSKNFGIYRERTGALMALAPNTATQPVTQGTLAFLNRQNYSFPPDHGARLVSMILTDAQLRADWQRELEAMRTGMLGLRQQLADELKRLTNSDRFGFIAGHRGMFSRLGATPAQVAEMREKNGIYMVGDGRVNIAGLNAETVPVLAAAMVAAGV